MEVIDRVEKEPCSRCRHSQKNVCMYPASDFYLIETDCEFVDFSKCVDFFSEIGDENLQAKRDCTLQDNDLFNIATSF